MSEHATRAAKALRASLNDPNLADGAEKDLAAIIDQRDEARSRLLWGWTRLGVARILQIVPAGDHWCARFGARDQDGKLETQWFSKVAVWALCEDERGRTVVTGMDEGEAGLLQFSPDTPEFIGFEYKGDVPELK